MSRKDVVIQSSTVLLGVAATILVAILLDRLGWNNAATKVLTIVPTALGLFFAERQIKNQSKKKRGRAQGF